MAEYHYLISSLPMLHEGAEPIVSSEQFLDRCADWLSPEEICEIRNLQLSPPTENDAYRNQTCQHWATWESELRNQLAKLRDPACSRDPEQDKRQTNDVFPYLERPLQEAVNAQNPLQMERSLDHLRWLQLEELEATHLFDFDRLCCYRLKLLILEKWTPRKPDEGAEKLSEISKQIFQQKNADAENSTSKINQE